MRSGAVRSGAVRGGAVRGGAVRRGAVRGSGVGSSRGCVSAGLLLVTSAPCKLERKMFSIMST